MLYGPVPLLPYPGAAMIKPDPRRASQSGYSLVETMFIVGIMGVLSGIAVVQLGSTRSVLKGDAAMRSTMAMMTQAREIAITQRRNMRLVFDANSRIQIIRENVSGPDPTTTISTAFFEGPQYLKLVSTDTPDAFGSTDPNVSVYFYPNVSGNPPEVKFTSEGKFVNGNGESINGTILTALPNEPLSTRAVTIMGSTGRIRAFRWNGIKWDQV